MAGESVCALVSDVWRNADMLTPHAECFNIVESILREGLAGKFDPIPMKQARAYAKAAGVKVGRMVGV